MKSTVKSNQEIDCIDVRQLIEKLAAPRGVSGNESPVAEVAKDRLSKYCDEVKLDKMGNLLGLRRGHGKKKILLEAHMDQVGLIVTKIEEDGCLRFDSVGGIDNGILPCMRVRIFGKETIIGIIVLCDDKLEKPPKIKDMKIYTGYDSAEEVKKYTEVGDLVAFDYQTEDLLGTRLCSGALDNRCGMAAMLLALEKLEGKTLDGDVYTLFSTQEEVGLRGSITGAFSVKPDIAVVVDVTHGVTPDSKDEPGVFDLGSGAVIFRGPNTDYDMSLELINLAKEKHIPYAIEAGGGPSGTTAWAVQTAGEGVLTMLISIPLRYMHTNVEVLDISDIEAVAELVAAAVEKFSKGGDAE